MVRRTSFLCGLALLAILLEGAAPANAQQRACFAETGHCIDGALCSIGSRTAACRCLASR
jgi:hypothetical protein